MTIGNLPAGKKAYSEIGATLTNPGETLLSSEERTGRAAFVMIAGLGMALLRSGWKVETGPGRPLELKKADATIVPHEVISRLVANAESYKDWKIRCDELGISAIPLAAITAGS
jgi:hypothetical protein